MCFQISPVCTNKTTGSSRIRTYNNTMRALLLLLYTNTRVIICYTFNYTLLDTNASSWLAMKTFIVADLDLIGSTQLACNASMTSRTQKAITFPS